MKTTPLWLPVPLLATVTAASAPASVPPIIEDLVGEYTRQPMRVPSNQTVGAPILGNGGAIVAFAPTLWQCDTLEIILRHRFSLYATRSAQSSAWLSVVNRPIII
eukprot:SAG31_NODE_1642_length_7657_cov_3.459402_2_plen_105_part_00